MGLLDDIDVTENEVVMEVRPEAVPMEEQEGADKELVLAVQVDELKAKMEAATIEDEPQYLAACEWLKDIKAKIKEVKDYYEPERKSTHEAYMAITGKIKKLNDILSLGEKIVKGKINGYLDEKERLRRIEEEKRLKAQREEEERLRKEAEARRADNPEAPEEEPDLFTPAVAEAAPPAEPVGKNDAGVSFAAVWKWDLEDLSKVPLDYLMLDEKKINGIVRAMKGDTNIPGIKVRQERQVRA